MASRLPCTLQEWSEVGLWQRWLAAHYNLCSSFHSIEPFVGSYFQPRIASFHSCVTSSHKGMWTELICVTMRLGFLETGLPSLHTLGPTGCKEVLTLRDVGVKRWKEMHPWVTVWWKNHLLIRTTQNWLLWEWKIGCYCEKWTVIGVKKSCWAT